MANVDFPRVDGLNNPVTRVAMATVDALPDVSNLQNRSRRCASATGRIEMREIASDGFLRLHQIVGEKEITPAQAARNRREGRRGRIARPGTLGLIPVSRSTWWAGVRAGRYPKPIKIGNVALWRVEDIRRLLEEISAGGAE